MSSAWPDRAGAVASIGCAIHCAAMPMAIAYLPGLGLSWLAGEMFHRWMVVVCFVLAAAAFWPGWRKHGSLAPAAAGAVGLGVLCFAAFGIEADCCAATTTASESVEAADDCCMHCQSAPQQSRTPPQPISLAGGSAALLTPLGGLLLIVGHLTNHRKSCRCRGNKCCQDEDDRTRT
jgi:hypothetical protein